MKLTGDKWQVASDKRFRAMQTDSCHLSPVTRHLPGFTLLEVMFAVVAFCTATIAILALVSQSLDTARRLQRPMVDAGLVASQLSLTNKLVEGDWSGDLGELLGNAYKGNTWSYAVDEVQSNKLFQAVIVIQRNEGNRPVVSKMTVLFYRPDSPAGSLDGGNFTK
jgi:type II secretory pathway pseudopilin PulG